MKMVSCIIPSYKRSDTIGRSIDSILKQTYTNVEILVVDDNIPGDMYSKELKELIKAYDDPRVKLVTQSEHINGAVARNFGIQNANGEYIAFLDDDDEWESTKIEKQVRLLDSRPDISGCSTLYSFYNKGIRVHSCKPYDNKQLLFKVLLRQVKIFTSTFMAKREALLSIGGFDPTLKRHQDLQLFTDFLDKYQIEPILEDLVSLHTDSEINRPNSKALINHKQKFFDSIADVLLKFNKKDIKRIKRAHNYEVAFIALNERKFGLTIKYILKSGISIIAIKDLIKRIKDK